MARRGPSHAGPYGLACSNCFKAKSRCVAMLNEDKTACQRCNRLGKKCQPSDSFRQPRIIKKGKTSTARIAELESKVDSLLVQLQSRDGKTLHRPTSGSAEESVIPSIEVESDSNDEQEIEYNVVDKASEEGDDGEILLDRFRSKMLPSFPFMHLPDHITSQSLETEWPLLFQAISFVAQVPPPEKLQSDDLKRTICESLLELDTKPTNLHKIGLLLAIVTYLTWGCDHIFYDGSMPRLMMQAATLAMEMMQKDYTDSAYLAKPATLLLGTNQQEDASATTEHDFLLHRRRAILGCYVLNSAVAIYLGRPNTFQWTDQMEKSLAAIRANRDCPSDGDFALLVQLQSLAEKASKIQAQHELTKENDPRQSTPTAAAVSLVTVQNELNGIRVLQPPRLLQRGLAMTHTHWIRSRLDEVLCTLYVSDPIPSKQVQRMVTTSRVIDSISDGMSRTSTAGDDQVTRLRQCLISSTNCVQAFMNLDDDQFCQISFLQWSQLAHSVTTLYYLTHTFAEQGWDLPATPTNIDMPLILDRIIKKCRLVEKSSGMSAAACSVRYLGQKMSKLRASIVTDGAQIQVIQRKNGKWEHWKANLDGFEAQSCDITRVEGTLRPRRGPFDYVFE